jgi:hypothetical protein
MATKNKTTQTTQDVTSYIEAIAEEKKRADAFEILKIMKKVSGFDGKMWGPSIIGFGSYHYKYESGREGDAPLIAFSPRKTTIALYLGCEAEVKEKLLQKLGKHKGDKGCIHIKTLNDIDIDVFKSLIQESLKYYKTKYST